MSVIQKETSYQHISRKSIIIQVSPFPPEPGTDYHEMLANKLAEECKTPVIVLAGLHHLDVKKAIESYGIAEKRGNVIVCRAFWAPRITECKRLGLILKYVAISLKVLIRIIELAKRYSGDVRSITVHFHYGPTTWSGGVLGEHYPLGMILARLLGARVLWTIHAFLTPYQLIQEARERRTPLPLVLLLIAYYLLLAKIAAKACHKIIVLVDSPNAPITRWLSEILGKDKVEEQVHPTFRPLVELKNISRVKSKKTVTILCLGYIRREKGYHCLLRWLVNLKNRDPEIFNRIQVVIAGTIDRKKVQDLIYLKELLEVRNRYKLSNVRILLKKLSKEEFHRLLAECDVVWCAYERKYGPSGILAWARTYNKKPLTISNLWSGSSL